MEYIHFDRPLPLFPLPNCVLFPGVVQPLHIFEPRYLQMMSETLQEQSVIVMALLRPGWEKNYYGRPPVHEIVCAGKIIAHEQTDDGKYNLILHGVARARILSEKKRELYRVAMLEPIPDPPPVAGASHERLQRKILRELFEKSPLKDLTVAPSIQALFEDSVSTARLIDVIAFTLVREVETKQRLLEAIDTAQRGELLLRELVGLANALAAQGAATCSSSWPPHASVN